MKKLIIPLLLLSLNSYSQRFKTGYEQKPYGIYAGGEVGFGNLRQVVVASATVGYHTDNNFL